MNLMVGNIWDFDYIDDLDRINQKFPNKITEIYGSLRSYHNPIGSARPDYRIPEFPVSRFRKYINKAHSHKIQINYTINNPCIGEIKNFDSKFNMFGSFLKSLENDGVDRVTVAHPLILDIVEGETSLMAELSTILHIDSVATLREICFRHHNIDKLCVNIYKNRNFSFLNEIEHVASLLDIRTELMVNEFCSIAGAPCQGYRRMACYNLHCHGGNENSECCGFPIKGEKGCITSRIQFPPAYLMAPFILPEWMDTYFDETCIKDFKITGRTHKKEEILPIIEAYAKGSFRGNLLDLWLLDRKIADLFIPTEALIYGKFLDHFLTDYSCDIACKNTCNYCTEFFKRILPLEPIHRSKMICNDINIGIEGGDSNDTQ